MGAINIKRTGSGSDIALSSDGTSLLLDGTAIGGGGGDPDLYRDNASSATTPVASGTNALAIGNTAVASGENSFAIGSDTDATGLNSLALGKGAQAVSTRCIAIGLNASAQADRSIAIGNNGNVANATYATAIGSGSGGSGSEAHGSGSVALSNSRTGGTDSLAAVIANNTSSYGATGANSVAIGQTSKATSDGSVAIGKSCISNGGRTVALGMMTTASGFYSFAVGALSEALQDGSVCTGIRGKSDVQGKRVHSSSTFSAQIGNCQTGETVLGKETTDATPAQLTSIPGNAASATNSITLPNNSCYGFTGTVIARENSAQTNDFAVWEIKGGAVRAGSASTTALGSYNINKISESTGAANWSIALSADTTNGAVAITVTGEASHSIRWVATVNTTEVTY